MISSLMQLACIKNDLFETTLETRGQASSVTFKYILLK